MKLFFAIFISSFFDPIRWVACIFGAWFIKNFFGALAVGILIPFATAVLMSEKPNASFLFIGALASVVIVFIFHSWRRKKHLKKLSEAQEAN